MTKTNLIDWLINDDIDTIKNSDEDTYLYDLMFNGFQGYNTQTLKQLRQEYKERRF